MLPTLAPRRKSRAQSGRLAAIFLATATAMFAAGTPSAADGFDPNLDGNVYALATQADGSLLVGGQFTAFRTAAANEIPRRHLARLHPDGTVDSDFDPNPNGPVRALLVQPDGKIIIGGDFTTLQPAGAASPTARNRIARLNLDGSIDPGFDPNIAGNLLPQVYALVRQSDGRIVAGGSFGSVQPNGAATTAIRNNLVRLNLDGSLDAGYDPNPNGTVLALALHIEDKVVVGGAFTRFQENNKPEPTERNRIARLNPSGTVDSEFNPNADNGVASLAIQRDGKIILGGYFTTLQPINEGASATRERLARLNSDGSLDSEFYPRVNGGVVAIAVQPDGGILFGGTFNTVWARGAVSTSRTNCARILPDGSVDPEFDPGVNSTVAAFALQPDGKVVLGGYFTRARPVGSLQEVVRNRLARLNSDGSLDAGFELNSGGRPLASVVQTDGKILIGGSFTTVGGATHNYLARLNPDGSVDPTYTPDLNGSVFAMALQPDGKVIIGGAFTTIGGETRNFLARMNPSGTIDSEFHPSFSGHVGAIAVMSDGRILVGGAFTSLRPIGQTEFIRRANLVRLTAQGQVDTTFDPRPSSVVAAIAVQADGKILIGGAFASLTPTESSTTLRRNFLARLNSDGSVDESYDPFLSARVNSIVIQTDGKAIVGGNFTSVITSGAEEETARNRLVRFNADGTADSAWDPNVNGNIFAMNLQADGKLLVGGTFNIFQPNGAENATHRNFVARLNDDGTLDPAFNLYLDEEPGNRVDSIGIQSNGAILISGAFRSLQPAGSPDRVLRNSLARINANGTLDTTFDASVGGSPGGQIHALAIQSDNRVLVAGSFSDFGGARTTNLARFRPEGTVDPSFGSSLVADGPVNTLVVRPDSAPVASQLGGFAWLETDGALRESFSPAGNARISGEINAVAIDGEGRIILGGAFADLSNTTAGNLVRISPDGEVDAGFSTRVNGAVNDVALLPDGRIVIVGSFDLVNGSVRNRIARLNQNGSLDLTFDPGPSAAVSTVLALSDGKLLVGGAFTSFTPNLAGGSTATAESTPRNYIARLNTDGTVDTTFNPNANSTVLAIVSQADGKLLVGGVFTSFTPNLAGDSVSRNGLARLNADGTVDTSFDPAPNGPVRALLVQPDGKIVLGGTFNALQPNGSENAVTRNFIARVNADGTLDAGFDPSANGDVISLSLQTDGGILLAGVFEALQPNGAATAFTRNHVARVNADGSLDAGFNPAVNGSVAFVLAGDSDTVLIGGNFSGLQPEGSIIVGGNFSTIGGIPARNLALLDESGLVNGTFLPRPDAPVHALLALPDGHTVAGGEFTSIAGAARNRLALISPSGVLDPDFDPDANGTISALALQEDGKILVGGTFSSVGGLPQTNLARLQADGTPDAGFAPAVTGAVTAIAVQPGGRILHVSAGSGVESVLARLNPDGTPDATFNPLNGGSAPIHTLTVQADGGIIVGGAFSSIGGIARPWLVRLHADGTIDETFAPGPDGEITATAVQSDGRILLAGGFTSIGGLPRIGLARLAASEPTTQALGVTADGSSVIWNRQGGGNLAAVGFELSTNARTWARLGFGTRVGNTSNWQLTGISLPISGLFYIRARGLAVASAGISSGIYESVREFNLTSPTSAIIAGLDEPLTRPVFASPVDDPAQAFDNFSGIASRSVVVVVPGEGNVEILASTHLRSEGTDAAALANLSTRGRVSGLNPLTLGFAIRGTEERLVLVRGIGPGLAEFGVTGALTTTQLTVHDSHGQPLAANLGWGDNTEIRLTAARTGAFPLAPGSADSAALVLLPSGNYTVQITDPEGNGGIALAEIYDAGTGGLARLVNVSSLGAAGAGNDALISGFVLAGQVSHRVLLRGIGPGLAQFGTTDALIDPGLALYDGQGRFLGDNDDWVSANSQISTAAAQAGAFALEPGSRDAAILATLPPGAYTMQVKPSVGLAGTALLEIYEVP